MMLRESFPTLVTRRLLLCVGGRIFPHAPVCGTPLLSLHRAQLGALWRDPISYLAFLTNFKKLGQPPLHGARSVRGAPDTPDRVAVETPAQMPGVGEWGVGGLDEMIDWSCFRIS